MTGIWLASYVVLWAFVLMQAAIVIALMRQLGLRVLNTGQAISRDGLQIGSIAPSLASGSATSVGSSEFSVVILASRTCQPCRALIPHINSFAREIKPHAGVSLVLDEPSETVVETVHELGVAARVIRVIAARGSHDPYKVRVTPFAFLLDAEGRVIAKGLVNNGADLKTLWQHRHHLTQPTEVAVTTGLIGGGSDGHTHS
jgi:hypothetical protein